MVLVMRLSLALMHSFFALRITHRRGLNRSTSTTIGIVN